MTTIVTRITGGTAKNAPLTNTELDNNFINLNDNKVETADAVSTNTANKVIKRDGSGGFSAGDITASNMTLDGTGAIKVPSGTNAQQPTPVAGMIRYNSDTSLYEAYRSGAWTTIDDAVSTNTISTIVKRDGSGGFSAGDITIGNITSNGTGAIKVPSGTNAQQPTPVDGMIRFNSDTSKFEAYRSGAWTTIDDAVSTNTINTIVKRDGSGGFSAGDITVGNITSNGTGAIKVPSGTTAEQPTPVDGMIRFNSDTPAFEGYKLGAWSAIGGGGGARGGSTDDVFYENSQIITTSYTVTSGKNAMSTGPITINSGAEVTIPLGSRWMVL